MSRPGISVVVRDTAPPRSQPTDIDTFFVVGLSEKGPTTPTLVRSMAEYVRIFGARTGYSELYDYLDVFFREGGSRAYVRRVVGTAPVAAARTLADATGPSVDVIARSVGDWANALSVSVTAGPSGAGFIVVNVLDAAGNVIESTPEFNDKGALVGYTGLENVLFGDADPARGLPSTTAAAALTAGDDDRDTVTATTRTGALDSFDRELGPGQVALPGLTTIAVQRALLAHAADRNRIALLDMPDSASVTTIVGAATALRAEPGHRYAAMVGPVATVPGITPNTTRSIPYSVVQAGMMARQLSPNAAAAGVNGIANYATSVRFNFTETDRQRLNEAGVIVARNMLGGVRTYGYRSLANPTTLPNWRELGGVRTVMAVKAAAEIIAEQHAFANIDGRGIEVSKFHGDLVSAVLPFYQSDALYGATPEEAFLVDTGASVNTPQTLASGELRANIALRTSPFAEYVQVEIVKVSASQALAA